MIATGLGIANEARGLVTGVIDRWAAAKNAKLDAKALVRLLLLEARRNLAILDATIGAEDADSHARSWQAATVLQVEVIETILGQGETSAKAFSEVEKLRISDPDEGQDGADFLTSLYVRVTALQSLALLNRKTPLKKVRIELRLKNMRNDFLLLVKTLNKSAEK